MRSLLSCILLIHFLLQVADAEDGVPGDVQPPLVAVPTLFNEPELTLTLVPPCCDPLTRPDGNNGNPICFEGSACCPDGTWSCSIGDGRTFPCGGVQIQNPQGPICGEDPPCCDPLLRPDGSNGGTICSDGSACCPDGTWSCSIGDGRTFPCGGEQVQNPKGQVCGEDPPTECCPEEPFPLCLIGTAACCPEGSWVCPNGDTNVYPCRDGDVTGDPGGPLCKDCCARVDFPLCLIGNARCCPDGSWSCPNGFTNEYLCNGVTVIDPDGPQCDPTKPPAPTPAPTPFIYMIPPWWDIISETFEGTRLKQCRRRQFPPEPGMRCSRRPKTCFWGNQSCEGVGAYPETQCDCKERMWRCTEVQCPGSEPTVTENSCPVVINNPPDCPATNPLDLTFSGSANALCESASLIGQTCNYGEESCCGNCFPSFFCSCFAVGEEFACGFTDACFGAQCFMPEQLAAWDLLVGTTCDPDAINAVLADYPNMTVLCIEEGSIVTADFRTDRVRIFFDPDTGLVSVPPRVG